MVLARRTSPTVSVPLVEQRRGARVEGGYPVAGADASRPWGIARGPRTAGCTRCHRRHRGRCDAPPFLPAPRDAQLIDIETQLRVAVRDAVNRPSRKPFHWGGLAGYQQLEGVAHALHTVRPEAETAYLQRLTLQVDRGVEKNRALAQDLTEAHRWLGQVADCLRYPPSAFSAVDPLKGRVLGDQVRREMDVLLRVPA